MDSAMKELMARTAPDEIMKGLMGNSPEFLG